MSWDCGILWIWFFDRIVISGQALIDVLDFCRGDSFEEVTQVLEGIFRVDRAVGHEGVEDTGAPSCRRMPHEHPVFASQGGRTDFVFHRIVVDADVTVIEVSGKCLPLSEQVGADLADFGAWPMALINWRLGQSLSRIWKSEGTGR